ncbi:hypothetical protein ACCT03_34410 [Rhizobium johnstonii]|uniref:hypothetical protein n=1 Tax=Rhizobium johnstonii TaxID=3019933 RepID=UPI003F9A9988
MTFSFRTLAIAATVLTVTQSASATTQFEQWWHRHENVRASAERLEQARQTSINWYGIHKLNGFCSKGGALNEESILADPNMASCCAEFPKLSLGGLAVDAVSAMPWYPSIDKIAKEKLWSKLADEALAQTEDELKETLKQSTHLVQDNAVSACLKMLERRYPE